MEDDVKYCLNCKRNISAKNYVIHSVHCERNIQICSRCSEPVSRSELEKHEEEFHSKVSCSECGISEEKWQIEKHKETCAKRLVPCEYCELEVPLDNFSEHIAACGSRTEQCPECMKHVMKKDLGNHPINCSRREPETVPCEYCEGQINVNEMMEHTVICETRTERCLLCNEHVMVKDRDTHFITCGKGLNFNESVSCDYCGGSFSNSVIGRHIELCKYRMEKCNECNNNIERKDMEFHLIMCKQKRHLNRKVSSPCKYCRKLYPDTLLQDHIILCGSRNQKCDKCENDIPLKNIETHVNICKKRRQIPPEFPCKYCGEPYPANFLEDHADKCGNQTKKCDKCDKFVILKNMEKHSDMCKESMSKTHGNCLVCHQSITWMEMNIHSTICAQVNSEIYQNEINEITLQKESEALRNESSDKKKSKLDESPKRCSFCFENFPCWQFPQHLKVCEERPYNCDACLKAMPYRKKEEHERSCLSRQTKSHADDYLLCDEETDDNKEVKKFKKCHFCDGRFTDVVFQHHLKECKHREEECTFCSENVPVKDMQNHKLRKCNFPRLAENKNFNNYDNANTEASIGPSKNFERKGYLEEKVEICPSCKCKIPRERYHHHLILCFNKETQCHFCGIMISKKSEHSHFRECKKILQMVMEDNNPHSKKKKENTNKEKTFTGLFSSLWNRSHKDKSFERNNARQDFQEFDSWQSNRSHSYTRDNVTAYPTTRLNVVNELPCEFCNELWPSEFLIEHESGCRPDLVSFPKANDGNEHDERFAAAAATTASQISHTPVLDASPKGIREEDTDCKVSRRNQTSIRERVDYSERERNAPQKQINAKDKFFYYPSQDTDDTSRSQLIAFRKKRYPQTKESQEPFKTKSDPRQEDYPKKNQFTSFKFSTSKNDDESENDSYSRKENEDILSVDIKKYDETEKSDSCNPQVLSAESSAIVDYCKSDFNPDVKAIGSERIERKRIMHSRKDVDVNKDFKEIYAQKLIPFDENIESEPSKGLEITESRTFNQTIPALWNTESTISIDRTLRSHPLKFFADNYDKEARGKALSSASENIDSNTFDSSRQETDYDAKNNETFGSSFVESINNNQNEEKENDTKSERSNSDDIFYDADDGGTKYLDTESNNFHGRSTSREEKGSHDFQNLNFGSSNEKYKVNSSNLEDLNTDVRVEVEDLSQKDYDLGGYFQFLHKSIKQSDEAAQRMIGDVEKLSCKTAGICKCHNAKCSCELSSLTQKASSLQAHFSEDASCSKICSEPMDIEPFDTETKIQNEMKPKKNIEFSSEKKVENENVDEMQWKKVNSF